MNSQKLKNKTVIVAGGSGQIGRNTIDILLKNFIMLYINYI